MKAGSLDRRWLQQPKQGVIQVLTTEVVLEMEEIESRETLDIKLEVLATAQDIQDEGKMDLRVTSKVFEQLCNKWGHVQGLGRLGEGLVIKNKQPDPSNYLQQEG